MFLPEYVSLAYPEAFPSKHSGPAYSPFLSDGTVIQSVQHGGLLWFSPGAPPIFLEHISEILKYKKE